MSEAHCAVKQSHTAQYACGYCALRTALALSNAGDLL